MEILAQITSETAIAWVSAIGAGLGVILGATWWLATVHGTVRRTEAETVKLCRTTESMNSHVMELQRTLTEQTANWKADRSQLARIVEDHEQRIRNLE